MKCGQWAINVLNSIDFPDSELVLGLVYAVGTNDRYIQQVLEDHLRKFSESEPGFGYAPNVIRLSNYLKRLNLGSDLPESPEADRIECRMNAGLRACEEAERGDFLALAAVSEIAEKRRTSTETNRTEPTPKTVHILLSLKREDEVIVLRRIYGAGFFLVGVFATEEDRRDYLVHDKNIPEERADLLIKRDQEEGKDYGQQTRKTFQLADAFVRLKKDGYEDFKKDLWRILDLIFGDPLPLRPRMRTQCFWLTLRPFVLVRLPDRWAPRSRRNTEKLSELAAMTCLARVEGCMGPAKMISEITSAHQKGHSATTPTTDARMKSLLIS